MRPVERGMAGGKQDFLREACGVGKGGRSGCEGRGGGG